MGLWLVSGVLMFCEEITGITLAVPEEVAGTPEIDLVVTGAHLSIALHLLYHYHHHLAPNW